MGERDETRLIRIARENGAEERAEPVDLGHRLRELRRARGWTLERAASATGLARSTLSKIENGQMSPTYDVLRKLAEGLEITVPQLFTPPAQADAAGRILVTKAGEGLTHPTTTYEHELLAAGIKPKKMLPYRARIRARSFEEFAGWVRHDGEEFLLVLTGIVRLFTEFHEPVDLRRGDSAYYDATMGHNLISISTEDATVLWVTSLE
ncbi:XRE family transcriptional regulator [Rhodobacter aestuarii]|uniref:Transcriptional regulator, XRE family with cupin sensor n=1 Tax=Rhodobacter aestuarii TaxID=453582 RepID=A0A1N7JBU6_9RHOB|nr:XRE family transcriptional regulator [Rhodobacter aestuarii]PTV96962.1 XRE family transcriptional regulator [Rhodobacter aestuarii]SIS46754.1 transcriptional regulator, XRE family with cupin sensor [Rhodobacter aestuarii]